MLVGITSSTLGWVSLAYPLVAAEAEAGEGLGNDSGTGDSEAPETEDVDVDEVLRRRSFAKDCGESAMDEAEELEELLEEEELVTSPDWLLVWLNWNVNGNWAARTSASKPMAYWSSPGANPPIPAIPCALVNFAGS